MQVNITLRRIENPKPGIDSVYAAGVQHNATLNADESATAIAAYLKVTPAQFKTAWRLLAASMKRNAKLGNQSTVDGAFRVANMVKGWFQPLSSPWDKSRNFLHRHLLTRNRSRDAIRELDGFLTDSRRTSSPCVRGTFLSRRTPRLPSRSFSPSRHGYRSSFAFIFFRKLRLKSRGPPKKRFSARCIGRPASRRISIK